MGLLYRILPCGAISAAAGIASAQSSSFLPLIIFLSLLFIFSQIKKQFLLFFICTVICGFYMIYFMAIDSSNTTRYKEGAFRAYMSVRDIPRIDGDRLAFTAEMAEGEAVKANYILQSPQEKAALSKFEPGSTCFMTGVLKTPKRATVPGTFDRKEYLRQQGIHWNFSVQSIKGCQSGGGPASFLLKIRKAGLGFIEKHVPETSAGIVQALVFGDRFLIEQDVLDGYQSLGIIHLLAISGLHVGILSAVLFYMLLRIGITREHAKWCLIMMLPAAVMLTGAAPSVLRAAFMSEIYLLSSLFKNRLRSAQVLSIAWLGLLLFNPYMLFQAGFQLSFAASFVFILSKEILLKPKHQTVRLLLASFVAQLGSLPILLFHFQEVSFLSVLMNLCFVPFYVFIVMPLSFGGLLILLVAPPLGNLAMGVLDWLLGWSHWAVKAASSLEIFTFSAVKPDVIHLLFYIASICVLLMSIEKAISCKTLAIPACLLASAFLFHAAAPHFIGSGEVTMLDVGQGDSIYISAPGQKGNVLIDTGGIVSFKKEAWRERKKDVSLGERVLIPFLASKGVKQLDALILTHADHDHMGEAEILIGKNKVKQLIVPKGYAAEPADEKLLRFALERGVDVKTAKRGDRLVIGDLVFYVLSPETADKNSKNNSSLVLWMNAGGFSWLLTGDLEKEGEREMLKAYPRLKADILKVGHHGSKGSTGEELINRIEPKAALISAGENNRYRHPHKEVLEILKRHQVKVFRTDRDGAVQYLFGRGDGTFLLHPPYDKVYSP
ncbi:DNA internalization-related competence protein ComEC/Rec2 [Bacillus sonorensis]|uniref:DNA internalization-related competence protein ComEC/Rec2 n=1 Tax=Bacillus sonorensis TaxID=119858 RepID=UPI000495D12E|nr:DNA internalization-related competence protein ComEC/Rec2 [Bacillus sonorensis]MCY7856447.1 DNA internalization-related competence protein ComEC/Rec2 [Bacillus sonorensis]MCY8034847.1 DNA internalization-related competence protein ComEC/Rec2 [Bacillus sonorensis]MCY8269540.1 DNA internalization-related competence protein ComEC/Rec2 [Bacillus sonorensis]MCY8561338.1 DNA internalization-related competence protein ComEC/Rec2 [Bacillus sonorensis]MCY8603745.1 DNA internalization-related compete